MPCNHTTKKTVQEATEALLADAEKRIFVGQNQSLFQKTISLSKLVPDFHFLGGASDEKNHGQLKWPCLQCKKLLTKFNNQNVSIPKFDFGLMNIYQEVYLSEGEIFYLEITGKCGVKISPPK